MSAPDFDVIRGKLALLITRLRRRLPPAPDSRLASTWPTPVLATAAAILAVTLGAGALRLHAVRDYTYGHPDEEIARAVVVSVLKSGDDDTNWERTDVVSQFHYTEYNFSSYYLFAADVERLLGHAKIDIAHQAGALRLHLRELSSVLGALCVLFAGLFAWRVGGALCGFTTALLCACHVSLFQDSLYARPETFVTLLTLLLLATLASDRIHRGLVLILAGLIVGLLVACKITFLLYLPFPLLLAPALLSTPRDGKSVESHLLLWSGSLSAYFVAIGVGFAMGVPYALRFPWEYVQGLVPLIVQYNHGCCIDSVGGKADLIERLAYGFSYLVQTVGYPALVLALIGASRLAWRRDVRMLLILSGPLLTLLYFLQTETFYERNFSQALPVVFLLVGLGIQASLDLLRQPRWLERGLAAALVGAAVATPAMVLAKAVDPALDGRYQRQIDAETETLSQSGTVSILDLPESLKLMPSRPPVFCGSFLYVTRVYDERSELGKLQKSGYQIVGIVQSVFGDHPVSTLQSYLSPSVAYLKPPTPENCSLEWSPLQQRPNEKPVQATVIRGGNWPPLEGSPRNLSGSTWLLPLYDSWGGSDMRTGTLTIGPFRACGSVTLPVIVGPGKNAVSLRIVRRDALTETVLYNGLPPSALDKNQWQEIRIDQPSGKCSTYTVQARDDGQAWGEWIGVGLPVVEAPTQAGR